MRERQAKKSAPLPWRMPIAVEDVAETGEHFDLVADAQTRAPIANVAGLRDLPRLEASFDVARYGTAGLRVAGRISATVGQASVVTLEPVANEVAEEVDILFVPPMAAVRNGDGAPAAANDDEAEPLIGGSIDLGVLATEFLILGLDPYPRKPGAVFAPPADAAPEAGPFAALAALKKDGDDH